MGKNEYRRNSGDYRSEGTLYYEESKGKCSDAISRRDEGKHKMEEGCKSDIKDTDDENLLREQRKKYDDKRTKSLEKAEKDSHRRKDGNGMYAFLYLIIILNIICSSLFLFNTAKVAALKLLN